MTKKAVKFINDTLYYPDRTLKSLRNQYETLHKNYTPFKGLKDYIKQYKGLFTTPEHVSNLLKQAEYLEIPLEKILNMLQDLESQDILLGDLHVNNVMQKNGILKVIDLGRTHLRGAL